jgi:hypothetical protein
MRIAAMAAMLAVANGSTAFAGAQDNGFSSAPGGNRGSAATTDASGRNWLTEPYGSRTEEAMALLGRAYGGDRSRNLDGSPRGAGNGGTATGPGGLRGGGV